jgi:membrane protease YdiL (CAAX protease family)
MIANQVESDSRRFGWWTAFATVAFAMALPTATTWLYFVALPRWGEPGRPNPLIAVAYSAGKIIQFLLPVLWWWWTARWRRSPETHDHLSSGRRARSLAWGTASGGLVALAMLELYFGVFADWFRRVGVAEPIRARVAAVGIDDPLGFLALAAFYTVVHSFLEEYYWRWFVFHELREILGCRPALVLSSLAFASHHVVLLNTFFPGQWLEATLPFSLGVAVGGAWWAWLYDRDRTILGAWASHALVDAALMTIGFTLVFPIA